MVQPRMNPTDVLSARCAKLSGRALVFMVWLSGCLTVWGETFPYVAYVQVSQTFARSGPGQRYYPTQQLPQGSAVEVFRQDESGWCAVRPPEGSFSWLGAHEVRPLEGSRGEVTGEHAVAYVGSLHSADRSAVQVLLRKGEQVELQPGPSQDPRWVRIAPPAGEFRWIAANHLSRTPPVAGPIQLTAGWTRQQSPSGAAAPGQPSPPGPSPLPAPQTVPAAAKTESAEVVPGSPAATELAISGVTPPGLLSATQVSPPAGFAASGNPLAPDATSATPGPSSPRVRFGSSPLVLGPATERVEELELRISQMVVRPREEWQFDQIRSEASLLLEKSDSVSEREYLRNILDRVARFERVHKGLPGVHGPELTPLGLDRGQQITGQTDQVRDLAASDLGRGDPFDPSSAGINEPRYDAVGRLKPVASADNEAPRYALVDDRGRVVSFVTPTPDVNLRPYVGMRIGVNGSRGFMPEYRKAHVTASRVTPIEDRVRR